MRLKIDTSATQFIVTRAPEPRLNFETGSPKVDTSTGLPLFATQLLALDDTGGEVLNVTVAGDPKLAVTQPVSVSGLVAIPWAQGIAAVWRSAPTPSPRSWPGRVTRRRAHRSKHTGLGRVTGMVSRPTRTHSSSHHNGAGR